MGNENSQPDFSDVQSHVSPVADETTIYAVMAGDKLTMNAAHFYGNASVWKTIFDANRDQLSDPDRIKTGQMLKISAKP